MVYERGSGTFGSFAPTVFPVVLIAAAARQAAGRPGVWVFENVVQHLYNANGSQLSEARLDRVTLDIGQQITTYWQSEKQAFSMTSDELSQRIKALSNAAFDQGKLREMRVDYYRRFAVPFASFVLALLAAPLALRFAHQGSFAGLVLAFALGFLWQGCDGWFRALGIAGYLQPVAAAWATDLLFLGSGTFFLWRSR
jgi:lipopolysaccharide export LptBFGC system permease protein LptF